MWLAKRCTPLPQFLLPLLKAGGYMNGQGLKFKKILRFAHRAPKSPSILLKGHNSQAPILQEKQEDGSPLHITNTFTGRNHSFI